MSCRELFQDASGTSGTTTFVDVDACSGMSTHCTCAWYDMWRLRVCAQVVVFFVLLVAFCDCLLGRTVHGLCSSFIASMHAYCHCQQPHIWL